MEKYLTKIKEFDARVAITRLRISAHMLEVERGRYLMKPLNERKCKNCSMDEIEDEPHVLLRCSSYEENRNSIFQDICKELPPFGGMSNHNKFVELITMKEKVYMDAMVKLIKNICKVRGCL